MNYNERKMNEFEGPEFNKPVRAYYICFTKINLASINNRVQIPIFIKLEPTLEIKLQIYN